MEDAKKGIDGPVLVLEDDIKILDNALEVINDVINTLPPSWELLAVGYKNEYCSGPVPHTTVKAPSDAKWCRVRMFLDTHAYILHNSSSIMHFISYENMNRPDPIDYIW